MRKETLVINSNYKAVLIVCLDLSLYNPTIITKITDLKHISWNVDPFVWNSMRRW